MSTTYTMRINEADKRLISEYSKANRQSMAEFMIGAAMEKIEDAIDLKAWNKANSEFEADSETYSLDEVERELGLA